MLPRDSDRGESMILAPTSAPEGSQRLFITQELAVCEVESKRAKK